MGVDVGAGPLAFREVAHRPATVDLVPLEALGEDLGRLGVGELLLGEVALPRQPLLVGAEDRREAHEPDPDERAQTDDQRRQDQDEVEHEDRFDDDG